MSDNGLIIPEERRRETKGREEEGEGEVQDERRGDGIGRGRGSQGVAHRLCLCHQPYLYVCVDFGAEPNY